MIGRTISHYKVLAKLGEGGMGVVYRAEDTRLHRSVALKFLPEGILATEKEKARFAREAQAAARLRHPNIATIFDFDEAVDTETATKRAFIAMELVEGESLRERISRGPFPIDGTVFILMQVAKGLQSAHQRGIVHRDIKPANIIIGEDGTVKILDFGLAKLSGETKITESGKIFGSVAYMSPEQIAGEGVDERSDIWSLGVVLFEMLTGTLPFRGDHPLAMMYSIANEPPIDIAQVRPDVPETLSRLCRQCLEKEKSKRPRSMREVLDCVEEEPKREREGQIRYSRRPVLRWPVPLAAAACVAVAAWLLIPRIFPPPAPRAEKMRLGVLEFRDLTHDSSVTGWPAMVQMLLVGSLLGVTDLAVVDPLSLNGLVESSFSAPEPVRNAEFYRVIRTTKVTYLLDGSIFKSRAGYTIQLSLVNPASAEVRYSCMAVAGAEGELPRVVDSLSRQVLDFLEVQVLRTSEDAHLRPWLSTRNMGALKAFMQASEYNYHGDPASEKYLRRAVELDSSFVSPRVWLIPKLVDSGEMKEAQEHYRHLQGLEKDASPFEQAMIDWAEACIKKDLPGQERYLRLALEYSPGNNILLYSLARQRFMAQDYRASSDVIAPAVEMKWPYSPAYYLLGASYAMLGERDRARSILEQSLSISPVYPEIYGLLATLSLKNNDGAKAREYESLYVARLEERGALPGVGYAALGAWEEHEGMLDDAIRNYRLAVSRQPRAPGYHRRLANILLVSGDTTGSAEEYTRALDIDSTDADAHFMIGSILEASHEIPEALTHYRACLRLDSASSRGAAVRERVLHLERLQR